MTTPTAWLYRDMAAETLCDLRVSPGTAAYLAELFYREAYYAPTYWEEPTWDLEEPTNDDEEEELILIPPIP